ncbi:MAG: WGR domain-containing protein [Pseudomonadota bacterium]
MVEALLYRTCRTHVRYYRIEIVWNLFTEASVMVEWGVQGGAAQRSISCHSDLRCASATADRLRTRALKRGYQIAGDSPAAWASTCRPATKSAASVSSSNA